MYQPVQCSVSVLRQFEGVGWVSEEGGHRVYTLYTIYMVVASWALKFNTNVNFRFSPIINYYYIALSANFQGRGESKGKQNALVALREAYHSCSCLMSVSRKWHRENPLHILVKWVVLEAR